MRSVGSVCGRLILVGALLQLVTSCGGDASAADAGTPQQDAALAQEDGSAGPAKVGDPCAAAGECPAGGSGLPACRDTWPGGACVIDGCSSAAHDCPGDPGMGQTEVGAAKCVLAPTPTCLVMCDTAVDCRDGYACSPKSDAMGHGTMNVCLPE